MIAHACRTNYTQLAVTPNMQLTPTARLEPTQIHLLATNDSRCGHLPVPSPLDDMLTFICRQGRGTCMVWRISGLDIGNSCAVEFYSHACNCPDISQMASHAL